MAKFELSKWYMDCVSDAGDLVIAYFAELRWGRITMPYASVLVRWAGEPVRSQSTVRSSAPPEEAGDTLAWASPALGITGLWTSLAAPTVASLFDSPQGRVQWRCLQPRARAEVCVGQRSFVGLGYAEHLSLTVEPWHLPIDELRWGRFVGERRGLVWVDWRGPHTKQFVCLDGRELGPIQIDEHSVVGLADGMRLTITEGQVLRSGALGETVFSCVPGLDRLPARILGVAETKWCAQGALEAAPGSDRGWVIHEVVRWPSVRSKERAKDWAGQALYGLGFAVLLPILLVAWAHAAEANVRAPAWHDRAVGGAMSVAGVLLLVSGWVALWWHGGGLAMNAYPPPRHVTRGIYALLAHPIYMGFIALCFGISIASGSASGFWLVSPAVALGCLALVAGYERRDLEARFAGATHSPWLGLPPGDEGRPSVPERVAAYVLAFTPWLGASARSARAVDLGVYLLAFGAPLVVPTRKELRALVVRSLFAMALVLPLPLLFPAPTPSFRIVLALLAADAWASRFPKALLAWRLLALALAVGDVATTNVGLPGVAASAVAYAFVANAQQLWQGMRKLTERVANSWSEVRVGPVRIINYGGWAAMATFGGIVIIGTLLGPEHLPAILLAAFAALVGSALWAQWIEGSPALLRPVGFYGGLLGICLASLASPLLGTPVWLLLGAYAVAGPYVQAMGRLRCLVQGCCHGSQTSDSIGIRYRHPRSRVCRLASHLTNVPIHATPLYSILWNVATAVVVVRLWFLQAPLPVIGGVYLILNGLGRFVEEAYRGEPQTPIFARLRLYQWAALVSVVSGALVTALGRSAEAPRPAPNAPSFAAGVFFGLITWVALGVDFPESNRRFSRLV
jgi:protein-S-isoprenylcysteine O-methyltransferase Ste14